MVDPSTVYLDHGVVLAEDVVLEPNVILRGRTTVGAGTRIASGSQIIDSAIGERCTVWASIVERSTVEDDVTIGPFSHLRPGAHVGTRSEIGNYAEIKNSRLGEHVRQHHNSYLGDADVGARHERGRGHDHRQLRRRAQAPDDDRGARLPGRGHDAAGTRHPGRRFEDRRRGRGDEGRAGRASWRSACRRGSASHPGPLEPADNRPRPAVPAANAGARGRRRVSLPIGEILFLVVLTVLEGFFVAAEIALVSIRRSRVEQLVDEKRPGARRVQRLLDDPGRFLAVSQLGLTVIGFLASAFAAVSLADGLARQLEGAGMSASTADGLALLIVTVLLALFTIVFAELVPEDARPRPPGAVRPDAVGARSTSWAASWRRSWRCSPRSPAG